MIFDSVWLQDENWILSLGILCACVLRHGKTIGQKKTKKNHA